ncbi:MAG: magnesium transporter MgtE N-terminal domain-containing protein [Bdellovibrio sp.]|jgi:flagellar motility protein MotE (MotC chaperone)
MKKTGYDQFFQKARQNSGIDSPKNRAAAKPRFQGSGDREPIPNSMNQKTQKATAEQLRVRMNIRNAKKKNNGIPWKLVGISFIGVVLTAAGYLEHERVENFLKKVEVSFVSSATAQESAAKPEATQEANAATPEPKEKADVPKKKDFTDEELNHFSKLNERKRELDAREEELTRLEAELAAQKAELETRMTGLESTRREISSVLEGRVKSDDKKVETLMQMYSNMKPQQAAKVFEEMDEDLAVEIIGRMKKKNAAEIMNIVKPEKAKIFSEKLAGYKRN